MKILLTSDLNPSSVNGVIISALNLKKELENQGNDVKLLTLSSTRESYIEGNIYYIGSFPFNVYPDIRASLSSHNKLINEIIEWHPDIIHSQCEFSTYIFAKRIAKNCNCPIVHTYHTMYEHYVRYVLPLGDWSKIVSPLLRWRLKKSAAIIAPTEKVHESLLHGKFKNRISVIPTGIDLSKYSIKLNDSRKAELLKELNIPENARIFGSVGRLAEEKNYSEVLAALKSILNTRDDVYLVLTGDGAYRKELEKEVHDLGLDEHVRFPGMISPDKIYEYYQILEFFVSASVSETQGLTYIEALANDLPVIARRDGAIDGVIFDDVNGYQYDTLDDLIKYIELLFNNPDKYVALVKGAKDTVYEFGTEIFGNRVYKLYEEVLK